MVMQGYQEGWCVFVGIYYIWSNNVPESLMRIKQWEEYKPFFNTFEMCFSAALVIAYLMETFGMKYR